MIENKVFFMIWVEQCSKSQIIFNATIRSFDEDFAPDGTPIYVLTMESNPMVYLLNRMRCYKNATIARCK